MGNIYVGMVLMTQQVLSMNVYKLFMVSSAIPIRKKKKSCQTCKCFLLPWVLTWTGRRCFQKCTTRWREWGRSWGWRARQHPAGHRRAPSFLVSDLKPQLALKWNDWLADPHNDWASHSSGQEEPVEPHQLCASLPLTNRLAMTATVPRPYQNSAADPHHEAADESLQTGAPSQCGCFVDSLHTDSFMSLMPHWRLSPQPLCHRRRRFTSKTVRSSLRVSSPLKTVFNLSMSADLCTAGPVRWNNLPFLGGETPKFTDFLVYWVMTTSQVATWGGAR